MEDNNGLELSLGLSCGGSSGKSKTKDNQSDLTLDEGISDRLVGGSTAVADPSFKIFFQTGTENQDQKGKQKSAPDLQKHESFWTDLAKCASSVTDHSIDAHKCFSQFNGYQELWASNNTEDEKSNKRKMPFEEINFQDKHEKGTDYAETHDKNPTCVNLARNSRVSVATEDASSGVNEDVAESEAEGSSSWLVPQCGEKQKSSEVSKFTDKHVLSDSSGLVPELKESSPSVNDSNHEHGKLTFGIPSSLQPLNVMTVSAKVPVSANAPNPSVFSSPSVMQMMPVANSEHPATQAMSTSSLQFSFGYSSAQLPTLETGSSWAFSSQPRHVTSVVNRGGVRNSEPSDDARAYHAPVPGPHSSAGTTFEGKSVDLVKCNGSSCQNENEGKGMHTIYRQMEAANRTAAEGDSQEGCTNATTNIRPGIASDVKFGGCGSHPDLPWVSTTGPGPNGKTISGVTYKYNQNEVKIVCACHGSHMSPEEFVQHASGDINTTSNNNARVFASFPTSNPATSAKS